MPTLANVGIHGIHGGGVNADENLQLRQEGRRHLGGRDGRKNGALHHLHHLGSPMFADNNGSKHTR